MAISRPPNHSGPYGKAWRASTPAMRRDKLARWLLNLPGPDPSIAHYALDVEDATQFLGDPRAVRNLGTTHLICVSTLGPSLEDALDLNIPGPTESPDVPIIIMEISVPSGKAALRVALGVVMACLHGELVPDPDYRAKWEAFTLEQQLGTWV
jgi:hypothetical protein